jgi:hypothetical protein
MIAVASATITSVVEEHNEALLKLATDGRVFNHGSVNNKQPSTANASASSSA